MIISISQQIVDLIVKKTPDTYLVKVWMSSLVLVQSLRICCFIDLVINGDQDNSKQYMKIFKSNIGQTSELKCV